MLYLQVADLIRDAIKAGEFAEGAALPSQNELCEHFGVSRVTMQAAVRQLRDLGLIVTRQGSGVFVRTEAGERDYGREIDALHGRLTRLERALLGD